MFGSLYADTNYSKLKDRRKLPHFRIIVFLFRRLFYVLIIIFLYKYPKLQQSCNIIIHFLILFYDIMMKPYKVKSVLGLLIYFFDFIAVLIFSTLPVYLTPTTNAETYGKWHIYIIIATIAISWLIIICINVNTVYKAYKKYKSEDKERRKRPLVSIYYRHSVIIL